MTTIPTKKPRLTGIAGQRTLTEIDTRPPECLPAEESNKLLKTEHCHNPFFTHKYFITKPKALVPASRSSSNRCVRFSFTIPSNWYKQIINPNKPFQLMLRIYEMKAAHKDYLPHDIKVSVNNKLVDLPNLKKASHAGRRPQRECKPLIINSSILNKRETEVDSKNIADKIVITWYQSDGTDAAYTPPMKFYLAVVRSYTSDEATKILYKLKRPRSEEASKNLIKQKTTISTDLVTSQKVRLTCPILMTRIKIPVRFDSCTHIDCFDANNYFKMNETKPFWNCPICNKRFPIGTLRRDLWFENLMAKAGPDSLEVEIDKNGEFEVTEKEIDESSDEEDIEAIMRKRAEENRNNKSNN